jgi:hypothetical protein
MLKFSEAEVCEIAGITPAALQSWIEIGFLGVPAALSFKPHQQYTLSQCIAIAAGALYRREGAQFERCAGVATFLAGMPIERLEADLAAGRTFPVPVAMFGPLMSSPTLPGLMIEPPTTGDRKANSLMARLDLKKVFDDVMRRVNQPVNQKRKRQKVAQ